MDRGGDSVARIALWLRRCLAARGVLHPGDPLRRLAGGRTNLVWQGRGAQGTLICKLSLPGHATPLFPNLPGDEVRALMQLEGSGLAPRLLDTLETPFGPCLVYVACPGQGWSRDPGTVARLLARLHRQTPPKGLRRVATAPDHALREGDGMLAMLGQAGPTAIQGLGQAGVAAIARPRDPRARDVTAPRPGPGGAGRARVSPHPASLSAWAGVLAALRPVPPSVEGGARVFLHGDPVPGNIVVARGRAMLIDWQCPALGDPLHDLALFLSPAMQTLGRGRPLDPAERAAFLSAYGDPAQAARLARAEPALSWRMAVYCAWRVAHGHADYAAAGQAESEHLQQLR